MAEKDLFAPIKAYFEGYGYVCDGEVNDIDLYMEKDGAGVAVELKQTLDFKAIQQAALRQKYVDTVFIGIFRPKNEASHSFKDRVYLLKRLGVGLILVTKSTGTIEIVNEPVVSELSAFQSNNKTKKKALSTEFQRRKIKANVGGVTRTKLITGYRQDALLVLHALCALGGSGSTKEVRTCCHIEKTASILRDNYYGWFEKKGRGLYAVLPAGYEALETFSQILQELLDAKTCE